MDFPAELRYTKDHEWVRLEGDKATLGITEFAQEELGEIVFVELPAIGTEFSAGDTMCVVESTKAASDVYSPISGKVVAVNEALNDSPDSVNSEPYKAGWMVQLEEVKPDEVGALLESAAYSDIAK